MKKFVYIASLFLGLAFTSCEKDEIGGTATEATAGQWYIVVDGVDANGEVTFEDPFGLGRKLLLTYNTSENKPTEMIIDDLGKTWEFKVKVNVDQAAKTFSTNGAVDVLNSQAKATVTNGIILDKATLTPSGAAADSICFEVAFSDDDYIEAGYWAKLRFSGFRYTGLSNDD